MKTTTTRRAKVGTTSKGFFYLYRLGANGALLDFQPAGSLVLAQQLATSRGNGWLWMISSAELVPNIINGIMVAVPVGNVGRRTAIPVVDLTARTASSAAPVKRGGRPRKGAKRAPAATANASQAMQH